MAVYQVHPLQDPRWAELVDRHPGASVFHTTAWIEALQRTYGFEPVAYTTALAGSRLDDGVVFCRVESWITGRRLVSLPFSDHCAPLIGNVADEQAFVTAIKRTLGEERLRYAEIRGSHDPVTEGSRYTHCLHRLDLRPDLSTLLRNCHKSSTQRKIARAEREGLVCESGRTEALLDAFCDLLLMTRRRHRIPPQPKRWFKNLLECFGEAAQIRVARKDGRPVAAILTLRHRDTLVYKYGCSDVRFNNLGGTHLLFWRAIEEGKAGGFARLDLGRTEWDNEGLLRFKDRWGAERSTLSYLRFGVATGAGEFGFRDPGWASRISGSVMQYLPAGVLRLAGCLFYRHVG